MPKADEPNTPIPSGTVAATITLPPIPSESGVTSVTLTLRHDLDEVDLLTACHAVTVRKQAMELISESVAELDPIDAWHEGAYQTVQHIRPGWLEGIGRVCTLPARGSRGLIAKAMLLSSLVERDESDHVVGGPAAQLAASLADDVLLTGCS